MDHRYMAELYAKAKVIADKKTEEAREKDPAAPEVSPAAILDKALASMDYRPNTLALFGAEDLAELKIPDMHPMAMGKAMMAGAMSLMAWVDPVRGPIKAACLAGTKMGAGGGVVPNPPCGL